jgi:putative ABC transport system permease protein
MRSDLRYALRVLSRAPGFTFAVVLVLALGIGSNSAIFSAVDTAVIRPLPYRDPGHLAMLWEDFSAFGVPRNRVSPATFLDWRSRSRTFEDIAAYAGPATLDLMGDGSGKSNGSGTPEEVLGQSVTWNLLPLLGVAPVAGRTFVKEEEHPDSDVVVLSYGLWQRRFGGDRDLIGRSIFMGNRNLKVIGVMPAGFQYPDRQTEFWIPIGMSPQLLTKRNSHFLKVVGRTRTDLGPAQADMSSIARQLASEYPGTNERIGITVVPLKDELLGQTRVAFLILLSAAGCVLLIACANVGNLLLARASARRREIAVRIALGATRGRLLRQILTENLLLAAVGGAFGLLFANWCLFGLKRMIPVGLADSLHLDLRVLGFTCAISILTGLLFALAPALEMSRIHLSSRLAGQTGIGRSGRLRGLLVIAEVAIALVLVVGAGLLIETLVHLRAVDPGFRAGGLITAEVNVAFSKSQGHNQRFYDDLLSRVRSIPGVTAAGLTSDLPYTSRGNTMSLTIDGKPAQRNLGQDTLFRLVSTGYLETIGARLVEGRFPEDRDREDSLPVVVINQTLARQYFPGESAIGHRIDTGTGDGRPKWMTVVGVVRDIRERGLDLVLKSAAYVPFTQTTITFFQPSEIAAFTTRDPLSLSKELQQAVWSVDREQPVSHIRTMDAIVDDELSNRTQILWLLGAFAALALTLAAVGIYGVLSFVVTQRTREIGLRVAIGASQWDVVRTVLGYAARLTATGLGIGIALAAGATRLLSTLLYGISPLDVRTFAGVSALLALVALAASLIPTRRAAAVDPVVALREE